MDTAANGFDILLWLGFLYLAPRLLAWKPCRRRRRVLKPAWQSVPVTETTEAHLRAA